MSLPTKYITVMTSLALVSAAIVGVLVHRGIESQLIKNELNRLSQQAQISAARFQQSMGDARNDVRIAVNSPDLIELARAMADNPQPSEPAPDIEPFQRRLCASFATQLQFKSNYLQFRYIGRQNDGREVVRVDRSGPENGICIVDPEMLQVKGHQDYFQQAMAQPEGGIYVSPIELNREFGQIVQPQIPAIRFAGPVYLDDPQPEGIVVLNLDMRPALMALRASVLSGQNIYLVNDRGQFLMHPDRSREFKFQSGEAETLAEVFPELEHGLTELSLRGVSARQASGEKMGLGMARFQLADGPFVTIVISIPHKLMVQDALYSVRRSSVIAAIMGAVIAIAIALFLSRSLVRPVKSLTDSIASYRQGPYVPAPLKADAELQQLADAFESMSQEVEQRTGDLEVEIETRREAERRALEQAERLKFFAAVIEHSEDAIITKNLAGVITHWNTAAERLYGYSKAEALGQPITMIVPEGQHDQVDRFLELIRNGQHVRNHETVRIKKNGELVNVSLTLSPVYSQDEEILGASVIARDITLRKRTEEQLKQIIEACPGGIVLTNCDGVIVLVNAKTIEMFGYSREELIGKKVEMLMPRELHSKHVEHRRDYMADPQTRSMGIGRNLYGLRKDGVKFPIEVGLNPIHTTQGTQILAIAIDISEQKKLNDQLRQAQKMEGIGRLAGGIAHDFNNLLTVINGCTELLIESSLAQSEESSTLLEEIRDAGNRAASLTGQLLAFSRKSIIKPVALNPNTIIENLKKMLGRLIGADIELLTFLDPDVGDIHVDPTHFEQVIVNLAVNARDAMPKGGNLTFETHNVTLRERFVGPEPDIVPGPYVLLTVADSGLGMTEDVRQRIFEPFFTTKAAGEGTGLGLSTIYGIIRQSGGLINVYSEPEHGTTFKIYLPRINPGDSQTKLKLTSAANLTGEETILLAEDEAGVRHYTKIVLEANGYTVIEAGSGTEAMDIVMSFEGDIHLLLTDVVMPKMSGQHLSETLTGVRPEMRTIYMSGYTDDALIRHGIFKSKMVFIQKPFTATGLLKSIRETLDRKE